MKSSDIRFFGGIPDVDSMVDALCLLCSKAGVLSRDQAAKALVLWWNPLHRQHLLGRGPEPFGEVQSVGSIPQIIGRAILDGKVEIDENEDLRVKIEHVGTEMSQAIATEVLSIVM